MLTSARPMSCFANYEMTDNDIYDHMWSGRLRSPHSCSESLQLRQCLEPSAPEDRFVTEIDLITQIIAGDRRASLWFVRRLERLFYTIVKTMPIHSEERSELFQQVCGKLWDQDCRRLRRWQSRARGRLSS